MEPVKKRTSFSVKQKMQLLNQISDGSETLKTAGIKFNIHEKTLKRWQREYPTLQDKVANAPNTVELKKLRAPHDQR